MKYALAILACAVCSAADLERSFWVNVSLTSPVLGYWGEDFPKARRPSDVEIANAARVLTRDAAANRLYLIYHHELPLDEAREVFLAWRKACPKEVGLVPTFVLRMYDKKQTPVFTDDELTSLCKVSKWHHVAVYDVHARRDQGSGLAVLAKHSLVRVGLQPSESLAAPFTGAVADTWSALCHGLTNDDWRSHGALRKWVAARNSSPVPIAWDLVTVAWDYSATKHGEYPGYDDANKNMPLPAGRNKLAAAEILATCKCPWGLGVDGKRRKEVEGDGNKEDGTRKVKKPRFGSF